MDSLLALVFFSYAYTLRTSYKSPYISSVCTKIKNVRINTQAFRGFKNGVNSFLPSRKISPYLSLSDNALRKRFFINIK